MPTAVIPPFRETKDFEIHGGDIDNARKSYPDAPEPWIDLSTGINPFAYPIPSLPSDVWSRLPLADEEAELRRCAAFCYGAVDSDCIATAPGSQALIQLIPRLIAPTEVAIVGPTYREHARCWRRLGHTVREIAELEEIADAQVVVLVNPNNPTGRCYEARRVFSVAEDLACRHGLLVVDEAFADLLGNDFSVVPLAPPSTIILRSFGKTFGLAGVRLGFAIADRETASSLRAWLGPWAVSGPAIAVGSRALSDISWLGDTRERLADAQQRLDKLLAATGCEIVGGTPLFRLARHPRAGKVANALASKGIHVRQFTDEPAWLRFGIPTGGAWRRLEAALLSLPAVK